MPKLDLKNASRIKLAGGEVAALKGGGFSWSRVPPSVDLVDLEPGPGWTGAAGSGFTTVPADPVRTTAKPGLRLIVPPNQHFTDTIVVGAIAMANDSGSLFNNFGIAGVAFLYEGALVTITTPGFHTIQTERGPRTYFGWWVRLKKPAGRQGTGRLYVAATARDTTMQQRVIGPFNFSPVNQLHDLDLEVNPDLPVVAGARYQSIFDAALYARSQNAQNPRFLITKAGKYQIGPNSTTTLAPAAWELTGRYTIAASVPGVSIGRLAYVNDADAVVPSLQTYWCVKGQNITFDSVHVRFWGSRSNVAFPNDAGIWLDGVTITTSSPDGKNDLMRGGGYARNGSLISAGAIFTECNFVDQNTPANSANLVRGCYFLNSSQDLVSNAKCVVFSTFEHSDQQFWNSDALAFTVTVPVGATLERAGGNAGSGANGGVWTATIGGTPYTFDVGNGSEAYFLGTATYRGVSGIGGYWCADVVDWLNSLPGFTAELSPEFAASDRRGSFLSRPRLKGQGFTAAKRTQIVGDGVTENQIVWCVDTHGDFYQHTSGILENAIVAFNRAWDLEVQAIFLAPILSNGVAATRDVFFVGNAFAIQPINGVYYDPNAISSQIGRSQDVSHLVIAHNTLANQRFIASFTPNGSRDLGYNLIKNNAFRAFVWNSGIVPVDLQAEGLVIHQGQTVPAGFLNVTSAGDAATLYADAFNGNFTPTTLLRDKGFEPAIPFDRYGQALPSPVAGGGIAALADELFVEEPLPELPLGAAGIALADAITQRAHGGMWLLPQAGIASGLWGAVNFAGSASRLTQASAANQPGIDPALGAFFGADDQIDASLFVGAYTVYLVVKKDAVSSTGHVLTDNVVYESGSTDDVALELGNAVFVDGVEVTTRGALFTATDDAAHHEIRIEGLELTTLSIGRALGGAFVGSIKAVSAVPEFGFAPGGDESDVSEGLSLPQIRVLARAWNIEVQPDLPAYPVVPPVINNLRIKGLPGDGWLLSALFDVAGSTPEVTLQWDINEIPISGAEASTLLLNEAAQSLSNGDRIGCTVVALNSAGIDDPRIEVIYNDTIAAPVEQHVGTLTATSDTSSITIPVPVGAQPGDLITAALRSRIGFPHSATGGWTQRSARSSGGEYSLWSRIHDGRESYTFTIPSAEVQTAVLRVDRKRTFGVTGGWSTTIGNPLAPNLNNAVNGSTNVMAVLTGSAGQLYIEPSGFVTRAIVSEPVSAAGFERIAKVNAGTVAGVTIFRTNTTNAFPSAAIQFTLSPAP